MPHKFRLPGARLVSSRLFLLCVAGLGALVAIAPFVGSFLDVEDPLQKSDAILVLAGTAAERPLEACDLYRAGFAPAVVLTREVRDGGEAVLARRGIAFPDKADTARDLLIRLGVPASAIIVPDARHDSTSDEANSFRDLIGSRGWHRVIAVTSKLHTRRTRMTLTRRFNGLGVEVIVHGSRYDLADPAHWWRRRADARFTLFEVQKYLWYAVGGR